MHPFAAQDAIIPRLLKDELVTADDVARAARQAEPDGEHRGTLFQLLSLKITASAVVMPYLAEEFKSQACPPDVHIDEDAVALISRDIAMTHAVLPLRLEGEELVVAMADPTDFEALEAVEFASGMSPRAVVMDSRSLYNFIDANYATIGDQGEDAEEILSQTMMLGQTVQPDEMDVSRIARQEEIDSAPIVRLIDVILAEAIKSGASDIHFESFETEARVRYRIDGSLLVRRIIPKLLEQALTARLKIQSGMDIAERRKPQDGRIRFKVGNRTIDFRVSTVPCNFGEKVVLRILDRAKVALDMEKLGIEGQDKEIILKAISQPNGIILLTGPTGSGKTTTLYTMLSLLNDSETNIMTAEDPVEYDLPGVNQVGVNADINLSFASVLRAFLRQDPDVILIGEMRDNETANIGIQAAQTGHLVLSTLHTNDAPQAVTRLIDMGLEAFQIASTLRLIIAQRLVRRVCPSCRTEVHYDEVYLSRAGLSKEDAAKSRFVRGKGCEGCNKTGYRGRLAIYEMLPVNHEIEEMILMKKSSTEIRQYAIRNGMRTLRMAGLDRAKLGSTTLEEVTKFTPAG